MKTALITGANSGFGYYMALTFARSGYKVYASTRKLDKEGVIKLKKIAKDENLDVNWLVFDVTNDEQVKSALNELKNKPLDVLVNNAGYGIIGPIQKYSVEDVKRQMDVNYIGLMRITYSLLPNLKKAENSKIINISSVAGFISIPMYGLYSASKHAVSALTEALREELYLENIYASLIEPAGFNTSFANNAKGLETSKMSIKTFNKGYSKARDPQKVANLALRIAKQSKPKLHNPIGQGAKLLYCSRKLMPQWFWDIGGKLIAKSEMK